MTNCVPVGSKLRRTLWQPCKDRKRRQAVDMITAVLSRSEHVKVHQVMGRRYVKFIKFPVQTRDATGSEQRPMSSFCDNADERNFSLYTCLFLHQHSVIKVIISEHSISLHNFYVTALSSPRAEHVVSIATSLQAGRSRVPFRVGKTRFLSPPYWLWGQRSLLFNKYRGSRPRGKAAGA